jgi:hypothetical protein
LCKNDFSISSGINLPAWDARILSFLSPRHKGTKFYGEDPFIFVAWCLCGLAFPAFSENKKTESIFTQLHRELFLIFPRFMELPKEFLFREKCTWDTIGK